MHVAFSLIASYIAYVLQDLLLHYGRKMAFPDPQIEKGHSRRGKSYSVTPQARQAATRPVKKARPTLMPGVHILW